MASVDWYKVTTQAAGGMRVHFDAEKRVQGNHANKDIDKSKSHLNLYIGANDYKEMLDIIKKRVKNVDEEFPPERLRKDRKTMTILETPVPQAVADAGKAAEFLRNCHEEFIKYFGAENVGGTVCHFDEVHPYKDKDGKERMSLIHGHTLVANYVEWSEKNKKTGEIEERKGINGHNFETKKRLKALNKAIHEMCLERYGISFNTGLTAEKKQTEVLKHESLVRENDELSRKNAKLVEENQRLQQQLAALLEEIEEKDEENKRLKAVWTDFQSEYPQKRRFEPQAAYNARVRTFEAGIGIRLQKEENERTEQNNASESIRLSEEKQRLEEYTEREDKRLERENEKLDERERLVRSKEDNISVCIDMEARSLNAELIQENSELKAKIADLKETIALDISEIQGLTRENNELKDRIDELENPRQSYGYGLKM